MRSPIRAAAATAVLLTTITLSAAAQHGGPPVMADLINQVSETEKKIVDLAKAMPEAAFSWRAGKARSTAEVLQHVIAENYFLPALAGQSIPAGVSIKADDYKTVQAYENRKAPRAEVIADLEKDAFMKKCMESQRKFVERVVFYELMNSPDYALAYNHYFPGKLKL